MSNIKVIMHENPNTGSVFTPVPGSNYSKVRLSCTGGIVATETKMDMPVHSIWYSVDNKIVELWKNQGLELKEGSVFPMPGSSKRLKSFKPFYYDKNLVPQKPDTRGEGGEVVTIDGKPVYHQDVFVSGGTQMTEEWVSNDTVTPAIPANPSAMPLEMGAPIIQANPA